MMRLGRRIGWTVLFQAGVLVANVASILLVSARYGPEGQGFISYYRAVVDFAATFALFGFPQAALYMINRHAVRASEVIQLATEYSAAVLILGLVLSVALITSGLGASVGFARIEVIGIALATSGLVLNGLNRSVALATRPVHVYNLNTMIHAAAVLIIFIVWSTADYRALALGIVAAALVAGAASVAIVRHEWRYERISIARRRVVAAQATRYGAVSYVPLVLFPLVTAATYGLLSKGGVSTQATGNFAISVLFVSAVVAPLAMVGPVLFDVWSKAGSSEAARRSYGILAQLGLVAGLIAPLTGLLLVEPITRLALRDAFLPSILSTQLLLLSVYAVFHTRLATPLLLSLGAPGVLAIAALIRAATILVPLACGWVTTIQGTAVLWTLGEFTSAACIVIGIRRLTGWPWTELLGLSSAVWRKGTSPAART